MQSRVRKAKPTAVHSRKASVAVSVEKQVKDLFKSRRKEVQAILRLAKKLTPPQRRNLGPIASTFLELLERYEQDLRKKTR